MFQRDDSNRIVIFNPTYNFRSPVSEKTAEKLRNCLAKELYSELFRSIMSNINYQSTSPTYVHAIGILDIAGFGKCDL